jgi:hypothetical protein
MGEYAIEKSSGETIKIGTCEDMYYLRHDQRHLVSKERGSVDVNGPEAGELRFRFPFPWEDGSAPGTFEPFAGLGVWGVDPGEDIEHHSLQFTRNYPQQGGILLSVPCPESKEGKASGLRYSYNGYSGKVRIVQQRMIGDELWTVCECGSCGAKYRIDRADAEELAVRLRSIADGDARQKHFHEIADRILAGYDCTKARD